MTAGLALATTAALRRAFLDFFEERGHTVAASAPLLPKGDPSLLFVNSGMVPFKDCFRGVEQRPYVRATSCQKSLRVSGKHNDYEQIGRTPRHHTFFEMLGNFSLGDYFKQEAIGYAWEFVTKRLGISPDRLWVSVHQRDDEAAALWQSETGILPGRIVRLGDDSNLWMMGDYGPRGYSSEIFYYQGDRPDQQSVAEFMKDDGTYLEFWNLVFMQFNRNLDGSVAPLPRPCIDTGIGLERLAAILQGVKSNYDIDLLRGIIATVEDISGRGYDGRCYDPAAYPDRRQWEADVAMRRIADHSRAIAFLIADGVLPSNEKEGYVLRRLIRRTAVAGTELGLQEPFIGRVIDNVIHQMGEVYPELREQAHSIHAAVLKEETSFGQTVNGGLKLLARAAAGLTAGQALPGEVAFKLHDTFGFPIDLTADILHSRGLRVDHERFSELMDEQRRRSRSAAASGPGAANPAALAREASFDGAPTEFVGYTAHQAESRVVAVRPLPAGAETPLYQIVLERSPFYAERGGQVGDTGQIRVQDLVFDVINCVPAHSGHIVHVAELREGLLSDAGLAGEKAEAAIDRDRRLNIARHHSATHLLRSALCEVLGTDPEQRGSYVAPDRLRFDFTARQALDPAQLREVGELLNSRIAANHEIVVETMPIEEAKRRGAAAVFGEKYGAEVRVVTMGASAELCGGTHVQRTGDIGAGLILSEAAISSGVRRIEAFAGAAAVESMQNMQEQLRLAALALNTSPKELGSRIQGLQEQLERLQKESRYKEQHIAGLWSERIASSAEPAGRMQLASASVDAPLDRDGLMTLAQQTCQRLGSGAAVIAHPASGIVIVATSGAAAEVLNANTLVKELIGAVGGKGGGRPNLATLNAGSPESVQKALQAARELIGARLAAK